MPAPRQDELIYDPNGIAYGDPVLSTATVGVTAMPVSSKPSGPGIVRSPEYAANKMANARPLPTLGTGLTNQNNLPSIVSALSQKIKSVRASKKPSGKAVVAPRFVSTAPTQKIAQVTKTNANDSMQKFLTSGLVDTTMMEGFAEMGPNFSDWAVVQSKFGLNASQLASLKAAHANYFGMALASPAPGGRGSAPDAAPMPMTEPAKKPNYILWAAIAVGGFFIVRKFLK
jgi:hypothetical protein